MKAVSIEDRAKARRTRWLAFTGWLIILGLVFGVPALILGFIVAPQVVGWTLLAIFLLVALYPDLPGKALPGERYDDGR